MYTLQSAGVQFAQNAQVVVSNHPSSQPITTNNVQNGEQASPRVEAIPQQADSQAVPESRSLFIYLFFIDLFVYNLCSCFPGSLVELYWIFSLFFPPYVLDATG